MHTRTPMKQQKELDKLSHSLLSTALRPKLLNDDIDFKSTDGALKAKRTHEMGLGAS